MAKKKFLDLEGLKTTVNEILDRLSKKYNKDDIVYLTQAEYNALPDTKYTDGKIYFITDADGTSEATNVEYDNSLSGLHANTMQDAIDELNQNLIEFDNVPDGVTYVDFADDDEVAEVLPVDADTVNGVSIEATEDKNIVATWTDADGTVNELQLNGSGGESFSGVASDVTYDNTTSELTGTNVQNAIDEVNTKVVGIDDRVQVLEENPSDPSVWISQADYDALSDEEKDSDVTYYIYDAGNGTDAYDMPFISENYEATNVGTALDEANNNIDVLGENLAQRNLFTYNTLSQIGMSYDNTVAELMAALPIGSMFVTALGNETGSVLNGSMPIQKAGELTLTRFHGTRGEATFKQFSAKAIWINPYMDGAFLGWEKVTLNSDLDTINENLVKVGYTNSYKQALSLSTSGNTEGYEAYFLTRVIKRAVSDGLTDGVEVRYHATWSGNDYYLVDCWGMENASIVGFTARSNGGRLIQGKFVVADDDFSEYNIFATNSDLAKKSDGYTFVENVNGANGYEVSYDNAYKNDQFVHGSVLITASSFSDVQVLIGTVKIPPKIWAFECQVTFGDDMWSTHHSGYVAIEGGTGNIYIRPYSGSTQYKVARITYRYATF